MNELIRVETRNIGDEEVQTVDARELHGKLKVGRDFSNWVKGRIEEAQLVEGQDYVRSPELASAKIGGQGRIEYHLTVDSAKHFAMLEKSEIGRQVRQYFIDFEKRARRAFQELKGFMMGHEDPATARILRTYARIQGMRNKTADSMKELMAFVKEAKDYIPNSKDSKLTCAKIQNIVHFIATKMTAGEIRMERANAAMIHAGLASNFKYGKGGNLEKSAGKVARNYLNPKELRVENLFIQMVLERLNIFMLQQGTPEYTLEKFTDFCYESAELLCGVDEVRRLKHKWCRRTEDVDYHTRMQIEGYNRNLALRDEGHGYYKLEQQRLKQLAGK